MNNKISQIITPTSNFPLWCSIPYFLKIEGGSGHGNSGGGKYCFTGTYLSGEQERYRIILNGYNISCLSAFCERAGIKFWYADTLEELTLKMKDLELSDITTENSEQWVAFLKKEKARKISSLEHNIKISESYISSIPSRKGGIRKDGNLRRDLQIELDNYRFRKEAAQMELKKIYKTEKNGK